MSHFWAKFQSIDGATYRLDTRVYLKGIDVPSDDDLCIGAIVGKNPGSAKQSTSSGLLQPLELDGDKLLPTVRNILAKAYYVANTHLSDRAYVQVLNLFYLCNPNLYQAISFNERVTAPPVCKSEGGNFPWVWYVWGGESAELNPYKSRFSTLTANHHFFFDSREKQIRDRPPKNSELAKHTQGLKHEDVVPYISRIIANG